MRYSLSRTLGKSIKFQMIIEGYKYIVILGIVHRILISALHFCMTFAIENSGSAAS